MDENILFLELVGNVPESRTSNITLFAMLFLHSHNKKFISFEHFKNA